MNDTYEAELCLIVRLSYKTSNPIDTGFAAKESDYVRVIPDLFHSVLKNVQLKESSARDNESQWDQGWCYELEPSEASSYGSLTIWFLS